MLRAESDEARRAGVRTVGPGLRAGAAVVLAVGVIGCTAVVPGTPIAAPPSVAAAAPTRPGTPTAPGPSSAPAAGTDPTPGPDLGSTSGADPAPPATSVPPSLATPDTGSPDEGRVTGPRGTPQADPLADECLLNATEAGALAGVAVAPPRQDEVRRGDGTVGSSCVATAAGRPVVQLNVYRISGGTPADYVTLTPGARRIPVGSGAQAAAVIDTPGGPTLQIATADYLVTILLATSPTRPDPSDDAWRTSAAAALDRLPR